MDNGQSGNQANTLLTSGHLHLRTNIKMCHWFKISSVVHNSNRPISRTVPTHLKPLIRILWSRYHWGLFWPIGMTSMLCVLPGHPWSARLGQNVSRCVQSATSFTTFVNNYYSIDDWGPQFPSFSIVNVFKNVCIRDRNKCGFNLYLKNIVSYNARLLKLITIHVGMLI